MKDMATEARRLLRACDSGALATQSLHHPGYPFGSLVSFVLDRDACPVILISRLAEHSHNLKSDPRSSLLVRRHSADPLADPRVTLVADALADGVDAAFESRFLRQLPQARALLQLGDFHFMRLRPVAVRYIGGFGAIHWIAPGDYAPPPSDIPEAEAHILDSIAARQASELSALCCARLERDAQQIKIIGIDCDGLDVRADGLRLRFDFPKSVVSADELPRAITALVEVKL